MTDEPVNIDSLARVAIVAAEEGVPLIISLDTANWLLNEHTEEEWVTATDAAARAAGHENPGDLYITPAIDLGNGLVAAVTVTGQILVVPIEQLSSSARRWDPEEPAA